MAYQLTDINASARRDPRGFMEECDARYQDAVAKCADMIVERRKKSPVVLLSGPSGSGKTTTAAKLREELERRGIGSYAVSMDDYFVHQNPRTAPHTPDGSIDYESPRMMDLDLLDEHFEKLAKGEWVLVPHFEFARQMRNDSKGTPLKVGPDEVAIFEGIHALNTDLTSRHPEATWLRLTRRAVRDFNYRGTDVAGTLEMWGNVRRGEKLYISPYKDTAHIKLDSSLAYEVSVMASYARPIMSAVPEDNPRRRELLDMVAAFDLFEPIDPGLVPPDSLLHEFIG